MAAQQFIVTGRANWSSAVIGGNHSPCPQFTMPRRYIAVCPEVKMGATIEMVVALWNSMSPFWRPTRVLNSVYAATAPREMRNFHKIPAVRLSISNLCGEQKTGCSRSFRSEAV